MQTIRLVAQNDPSLDEAMAMLASAPREFLQRVLDRPHLVSELLCIDGDLLPAPGTNEVRIVLQPSERFLELVAALRTGDFDHV